MKKIVLLIGMLGLFLGISGCQNNLSDTLRIALDIEDEGRYDDLFTLFYETTGITVSATYGQDISKLISTPYEPDIIKTSTVLIDAMYQIFLDMTPLIDEDPDISLDQYHDVLIDALMIDGKIYALPTSINTSLLYYNKSLFDQEADAIRLALDLEPTESVYPRSDWTYDDYVKAGVALSKYQMVGGNRVYSQFGAETQLNWWGEWLVYLNHMGGSFYQENTMNRVTAITSEAAIQATTFFRQKSMGDASEKFAPDAIESASSYSFLSGNVGMIFGGHMGDWFSYDALGLDWDIQVLPTPVGRPDAQGGEISADAFGISVRSKKVTEAFMFLKMWAGEAGAIQMYENGKIGALKNMEALILALPEHQQKPINLSAVFQAAEIAITLPREKDFSKVMREMVMSEIYKLMYSGRGAETDVALVLSRIKTQVDQYYRNLYG
ncbi:MAG: extracellular solute-binding protein [Candidatus Izemoplasmatales bacterium]|nr:extracellular solute-binding protein [Candidatus Izemoplasmatales bacterium]